MTVDKSDLFFEENAIDGNDIEFARFKLVDDNAQLKIVRDDNAQASIDDVLSLLLEKISHGHVIVIGSKQ